MATIKVVFQDKGEKVKVTVDPSLEKMMRDHLNFKKHFTPAEHYVLKCMGVIQEISKGLDRHNPKSRIIKPNEDLFPDC